MAYFSGLTLGDYLLWNWSLSNNHDVLALVSGLTLPPLAAAFAWLVALQVARLVARSSRRTPALVGRLLAGSNRDRQHRRQARASGASAGPLAEPATALLEQSSRLLDRTAGSPSEPPAPAASSARPPRKLAA